MKKAVAILLAGMMVFGLAGCGSKTSEGAGSEVVSAPESSAAAESAVTESTADTQEAETAPEQTKASSVFQFNPDNFEWWMLAVAAAVLVLGSGGVLLILHTGKMKEITRDTEQEDDAEDELPEK